MQPSNAEVRAAAVGRLKRAASLPRIKGGRRPAMHPEGTSEGEKSKDESGNFKQDEDTKHVTSDERDEPEQPDTSGKTVDTEMVVMQNQEQTEDGGVSEGAAQEEGVPSNGQSFSPPPTPTKRKRRSRSRSRTRSKDLKSRTPPPPDESSPEGGPNVLPPLNDIPVASPTPSRPSPFTGVGRLPFLPPTAPSTPAPLTPMTAVPTLQDLQQRYVGANLSRSQSASRAAAMLKLTGELPEELVPSPTLSRSATVSGSEQRAAARQRMLGRIQNRFGGQTDDALTSGGEDTMATTTTTTTKRRRRRSRKSSQSGAAAAAPTPVNHDPGVVDDRDPADLSASTDTPLVHSNALPDSHSYPATPLLPHPPHLQQSFLAPFTPFVSPLTNGNHLGLDSPSPSGQINLQWTIQQFGLPLQEVFVQEAQATDSWQERDVVIEEEDSEASIPPRSPSPLSEQRLHHSISQSSVDEVRAPHTSDAPSSVSGQDIPVIMSADYVPSPYKQDDFPRSPFDTPGKDRGQGEEEDDQILYDGGVESRNQSGRAVTNGTSTNWQQYTEQEVPIELEGDDDAEAEAEAEAEAPATESPDRESPEHQPPTSPSPGPENAYYPSVSPSSVQALSSTNHTRESASSIEPDQTPDLTNLPNATGVFLPRESYTDVGTDYEDVQTDKETSDGKWSKWKNLVRSNSFTGRRSRANSVTKREEKPSKRESGASAKADHVKSHDRAPSTVPPSAWNSPNISTAPLSSEQARQPAQPPSASASILSLPPVSPHRGGPSPIPPASPADLSRFAANDKLAPFPGLVKLDEERKKQQRTRRMSMSSPNLPHDIAVAAAYPSPNTTITEEERRERKLSHQYSDTGLLQKFRAGTESAPSSSVANPPKSGGWLPSNRNELKIWYKLNKFFSPSQPNTPAISPKMISSPILPDGRLSRQGTLSRPGSRQQKRPDALSHKPSTESTREIDDGISNQSATPKRTKASPHRATDSLELPHDPFASPPVQRSRGQQDSVSSADSFLKHEEDTEPEAGPSKPTVYSRPALSIIPEPMPSDQSWTISTDSSISVPSTNTKPEDSPNTPVQPPQRTSVLMERLETLLAQEAKERFLEEPPRRLLMSCSLTQVVDSDTIRERFMFIFNDILVLAKPLESNEKAMNRLFVVKHVIDLKSLHVITQDVTSTNPARHPLVLEFVRDFNQNPDLAVESLRRNAGLGNDDEALGKLLFNTYELDRTKVGAYLSRKARRNALKAYIDCFGFAGVRIDLALRAFALTIQLPAEAPEHSSDNILNIFATRWFDANAKMVSFDRDIVAKLVRIMVHLDSMINRVSNPYQNGGWRPPDYWAEWDAMVRTVDPRGLLPEELVQEIFMSLQNDRLRWAIEQRYYWEDYAIGFKRAPPATLVHRAQSDPIIIQINRPDPNLRIRLLSQEGITFDPPELNFTRSTEASFRMTGTGLGPKTIIFSLIGNNAQFYHGLPFSASVVVERPFMRHTFQIAFKDHQGSNRRYMFSTEDKLVCHQCVVYLRQSQLSKSTSGMDTGKPGDKEMAKAVKALSLAALRDVLSPKLSGNDIIMLCKQNSILIPLLSHVIPSHSS